MIPGLAYFILFQYVPMYGVTIAFKNYSIYKGFFESDWVGFDNFVRLFALFGFKRAFRNTVILSLLKLIFGFPVPIILAILINEVSHTMYKKAAQTILILPHFISWIIIAGLLYTLLSPSTGLVRELLSFFGYEGKIVNLMGSKEHFRGVLVGSHVWQAAGYGSVIYIATIATIDAQLYDAAVVDGAGKLRQLWHVTLPGLRSTIVILFILRLGHLMNVGFEQVFALYNPLVYEVSEILDTYVYKIGILEAKFSLATATGLFKSAIGLVLVLSANYIAKRVDRTSGLF